MLIVFGKYIGREERICLKNKRKIITLASLYKK